MAILSVSYIWKKMPMFACEKWGFIASKGTKYYIHPEKIIIEPWRGQHHVYGIFMIPDDYIHDHIITVLMPGTQTYCGILLFPRHSYSGINAKPGYHLMKGYLQTRTTVELIVQGKVNQLQEPSNWRLGYFKEKKQ